MINIAEYILDIFFPKRCIICSKILEAGSRLSLCDNCRSVMLLKFHNSHFPDERYFDEHIYCLPYIDEIKKSVLNLKFNNQYTVAGTFGHVMAERLCEEDAGDIDFVIPVPVSQKRRRERGYNQTELITEELCKITGLECHNNALEKIKEIPPLSSMNRSERAIAVKGAYRVCEDVSDRTILLTDDIYTTGSTVNECARMLKQKGAGCVKVLTLCVGVSDDEAMVYRETVMEKSPKRFFDLF